MNYSVRLGGLTLAAFAVLVAYQNCGRPFISNSDQSSLPSRGDSNSELSGYFSPLDKGEDISCPSTSTSGEFVLSSEQKNSIRQGELRSINDRHLIIHPQPLTFASRDKTWSDIYQENFRQIKDTFKNSESSFKIGTAMSLFALEGGGTCELEQQLSSAFAQAEANNIPLLVHVDFEWMIEWRSDIWDLNNTSQPHNKYKVEWSDWNTPINKFAIFWDAAGFTRKSRICYPNPAIRKEVIQKGRMISAVINKWRLHLANTGKSHLFIGVDPGWETGIQDYRNLNKAKDLNVEYELGYCALHHEGYSQSNPPINKKSVLIDVVRKYAEMECQVFFEAGIPKEKIFTHIVGTDGDQSTPPHPGRLFYQHSPLEVAFNSYSTPGFSLYPNAYYPELIKKHTQGKNWAITETAFANFNHLKYFAGDPNLRNINIYSWDMIKGNSGSISELANLMKHPLDQTPTPNQPPVPEPAVPPAPEFQLSGSVETFSNSVITGWACLPGTTTTTQIQIYVGDFYGTKNLLATVSTNIQNSSKSSVCKGNSVSGFSYAFTPSDRFTHQGKDIHVKATVNSKELWLYKPANYVVPEALATGALMGSVESMSGSTITGWACVPGLPTTQLQVYVGDFYGTKTLIKTISTGLENTSRFSVCGKNSNAGFSYQFSQNDKTAYQGKDIHIKAIADGKELWLYKPANYIVPKMESN
ncbi:MAG: hypothetical protein HUU57_03915 [Bdellovibrio sp.]|nr:hypothetical protein [Bdellovibrio sp.]